MTTASKVVSLSKEYTRDDLTRMDPAPLRALMRERTHHGIEVPLYPLLLKWLGRPIPGFGDQAQLCFEVWRERGLSEEGDDINWVKRYLAIAEQVRRGEKPRVEESLPEPFTEAEMAVVRKLLQGRRSGRDWVEKEVPDWMLEQIMEAGRAAPVGCNLDEVRFIVLRTPEELKLIWSDISTRNAVVIVICHDRRIPVVVGQEVAVPQNAGFDAAAAADHMLLMAHALGLSGVWLSSARGRRNTAEEFKKACGLPDYMEVDLHIAVGWAAIGTIKSGRLPLKEMVYKKA